VRESTTDQLVLDTKWKIIDGAKGNGSDKYGLSQADFYQLHAYGQAYLDGQGDVILIYPKTDALNSPLPVFEFPKSVGLRLWVLPFCLRTYRLDIPVDAKFADVFKPTKDEVKLPFSRPIASEFNPAKGLQ
jgi:5-methylcytosine-specific restriction enzyme subunit McrC